MYNNAPVYVLPKCPKCGALCNELKDEKRRNATNVRRTARLPNNLRPMSNR